MWRSIAEILEPHPDESLEPAGSPTRSMGNWLLFIPAVPVFDGWSCPLVSIAASSKTVRSVSTIGDCLDAFLLRSPRGLLEQSSDADSVRARFDIIGDLGSFSLAILRVSNRSRPRLTVFS